MIEWGEHRRELDSRARALIVEPKRGFYIQPRNGRLWVHHVTVELVEHEVDAMTGTAGHPSQTYLSTFFVDPDELRMRPVGFDEWEQL